jgi:hypothetical protein
MAQPRYLVRAVKFRADDESGIDWLGSDEPYWIFTAKSDGARPVTSRSAVFGDVDSGDTRTFETANARNVIWPRPGDTAGRTGPIGLSIQLWESDQGNAEDVRKKTEAAFDLASDVPLPVADWVVKASKIVVNQLIKLVGDDVMGSRTVRLPATYLAKRLPKVGSKHALTWKFHGSGGDLPFEVAGGPDYTLHLEIVRVA